MEPRRQGELDIDGQRVHWEEYGNPAGIPALYLHGGPGGSMGRRGWVQRFDADGFRIMGLDQRGSGASTPLAGQPGHDLGRNTTPQLIEDLDLLREHLEVDAWVLNGVSWGSTLALAYAQAHPERVLGIVLMAITTTSQTEVDWISEGCRILYPEAWDRLATFVETHYPHYQRGEGRLIDAVAWLMTQPDPQLRIQAADAWGDWEDNHIAIGSGQHPAPRAWENTDSAVAFATLVTHYWSHSAFLDPPLLDGMDAIAHIPGYLIHGRRDVSAPAVTPWELHRRWPASELTIIESEGHGGPAMVAAWADANQRLLDRLASGPSATTQDQTTA